MFLKLSALEKDCSFVNLPGGSLSDIPRLLQMIKYKLYLRQSTEVDAVQNEVIFDHIH
jgi:hypothetical protein